MKTRKVVHNFIYLSIYDIRHHKVTNKSVLMFLPIVMLKCTYEVCIDTLYDYIPMILGAAAGFSVLLITAMITHGGIGGGDIKLAGVLGLAAGLQGMLVTLVVSSLGAATYALIMKKLKKSAKIKFAFVPFMLAGYIFALLMGFC
jgi:prepilin signal peptidase PulO-like enzyme (type II secretory pathway)